MWFGASHFPPSWALVLFIKVDKLKEMMLKDTLNYSQNVAGRR